MLRFGLARASGIAAVIAAAPVRAQELPAGQQAPASHGVPQTAPDLARITLVNGETFQAAVVSDGDPLVLDHPLIGRMMISREKVRHVEGFGAPFAAPPEAQPEPVPVPPEPPGALEQPEQPSAAAAAPAEHVPPQGGIL